MLNGTRGLWQSHVGTAAWTTGVVAIWVLDVKLHAALDELCDVCDTFYGEASVGVRQVGIAWASSNDCEPLALVWGKQVWAIECAGS